MVPGSTFRYGSHFCRVTLKPRLSRRQPMEEAATPFPSDETTPPVTKIYFGAILIARVPTPGLFALHRSDVRIIIVGTRNSVKSKSPLAKNGFLSGFLRLQSPFRSRLLANFRARSIAAIRRTFPFNIEHTFTISR